MNKKQQQPTRNITVSHQSSARATTEELDTISNEPTNLAALTENYMEQNTFGGDGEFFSFINTMHLKASLLYNIFLRQYTKNKVCI